MTHRNLIDSPLDSTDAVRQYEYRVLTIPRTTTRGDARRMLTEQAEYGRWELARTLLYTGGDRKVWLRRRIIRVRSTLGSFSD
ncbi:MAG TPA: DUF5703 family protein [Cellulomonas sp.]